jgi:hypothetical protein
VRGGKWCDECTILALATGDDPRDELVISHHALVRYAERVLDVEDAEARVADDPAFAGRCRRGVEHILREADWAQIRPPAARAGRIALVSRQRALLIEEMTVVSVVTARGPGHFRRRFGPVVVPESP